jgi:hypothetical protein
MSGVKLLANTSIFTKWIQRLHIFGFEFGSLQTTQVLIIASFIHLCTRPVGQPRDSMWFEKRAATRQQ